MSIIEEMVRTLHYIFNFLENPRIPSDNNASERGNPKTEDKAENLPNIQV